MGQQCQVDDKVTTTIQKVWLLYEDMTMDCMTS